MVLRHRSHSGCWSMGARSEICRKWNHPRAAIPGICARVVQKVARANHNYYCHRSFLLAQNARPISQPVQGQHDGGGSGEFNCHWLVAAHRAGIMRARTTLLTQNGPEAEGTRKTIRAPHELCSLEGRGARKFSIARWPAPHRLHVRVHSPRGRQRMAQVN